MRRLYVVALLGEHIVTVLCYGDEVTVVQIQKVVKHDVLRAVGGELQAVSTDSDGLINVRQVEVAVRTARANG